MSNEKSMLPKGFGMPFVKVTGSQNKPIIDPLSGLPIGTFVTGFEYTYREEKDDECFITITTENPNLIDIPQFREQQYLGVQWGIVYPDKSYAPSAPRKVMVRDTNIRFSAQGIIITLKCTDGFSILKSQQLKKNADDNFLKWIEDELKGKVQFKSYIYDVKESKELAPGYVYTGYSSITGLTIPTTDHGWFYGMKEVGNDKLIKRRTFAQVGRTPYTALKDAAKYIPNGPYHVDGRDDTVSIHPTNFNQAPVASFTWHEETGEIISFNVTTRKKLKALDVAKKSQIDGETKSLDSGVTQTDGSLPDNSVDGITGETIPSNAPNTYDSRVDGITGAATRPSTDKYKDEEATKKLLEKDPNYLRKYAPEYLEKVVNEYKAAGNDPMKLAAISLDNYTVKVKAKVKETVNPEDFGSKDYQSSSAGYDRTTGWQSLERDKTIQIVPKSDGSKYEYWDNPEVVREKEIELNLSAKDLLGYAGDADSSKILAFNQVNDALQKQVEATMVTIGQPTLMSSQMLSIQNVSQKYSGDWYIKEASHRIDASTGYLTTFELIKKTISNGTVVQSDVKVNTQSLAMKVQKIANDLTPAEIAKAEQVKAFQEKILKETEDMGEVTVITGTDEQGREYTEIQASQDAVSLNKATQTANINKNDQILKDKTK